MKRKIAKKTLVMSVIAIVALSMVGLGATIDYLTNPSYAEMSVDAPPVKMEIKDGGDWRLCEINPLNLGTLYGTETAFIDFRAVKLAPNDLSKDYPTYGPQIEGTLKAVLHCDQGISEDDLDMIKIRLYCPAISYDTTGTWDGETETWSWTATNPGITGPYVQGKNLIVEGDSEILWNQWGYNADLELTFDQCAQGDYSFSVQLLP